MLLSEDLLTQVEVQAKAAEASAAAGPVPRDPGTLVWAGALRWVALAGAIAAGLACLSLLLPGVGFLALLWAVISPVVVIGLFQSRSPQVPMSAGFGARMGLLTGLAVSTVFTVIFTAMALVERFALKGMGEFDRQWVLMLDQLQTRMVAQSGPDALPLIKAFALPEFRAGFVLCFIAFGIAILLTITTVGGAFAGFTRSRTKA